MLNFKRRLIPIFLCVLTKVSLAQEVPQITVYPKPHELVMEPGSFPLEQALYVKAGALNPELQNLLGRVFKLDGGKKHYH